MKMGGKLIYSGPLGQHSSKVVEYFEASTLHSSITILYNFMYCHSPQMSCDINLSDSNVPSHKHSVIIYKFNGFWIFILNRVFLEFQKSKLITTQLHGCWKLHLHLPRHNFKWILHKFIGSQLFTGEFSKLVCKIYSQYIVHLLASSHQEIIMLQWQQRAS